MTAGDDVLAMVTFTSQPGQAGQQSSAEVEEGRSRGQQNNKRKSDERILPSRGHPALESNEAEVGQIFDHFSVTGNGYTRGSGRVGSGRGATDRVG